MSQSIVTPRTTAPGLGSFNPQNPQLLPDYDYSEEFLPPEDIKLELEDYIVFGVRILVVLLCLASLILILVNVARGNRLKSWRLYFIVGATVLAWIMTTLYHDCIDRFYIHFFVRDPQSRSIFWCFSNLFHGLSLYLVILLLAHLSDMQHRSHWLLLIAAVILIPLVYAVGILVTDLRLDPDTRLNWKAKVAINSVRVLLFNIISTILLIFMGKFFCTRTLYGTYSERRTTSVVIVSRWTFAFLLLHNLVQMASYAVYVVTTVPSERDDLQSLGLIVTILNEVALLLIVLAVPFSYIVGVLAQCCGLSSRDNNMEMDKVDKIYTDVWTTPSARSAPMTSTTDAPANHQHHSGLQNGVVARRPPSREQQGSNSTLNSIDSIGELPRIATNPAGSSSNRHNKRVRESYMEAVSMGSLDETGSMGSSRSTEPIDL